MVVFVLMLKSWKINCERYNGKKFYIQWPVTCIISVVHHYGFAVLIGHIVGLACPSVHLFVPYGIITQKLKGVEKPILVW